MTTVKTPRNVDAGVLVRVHVSVRDSRQSKTKEMTAFKGNKLSLEMFLNVWNTTTEMLTLTSLRGYTAGRQQQLKRQGKVPG